jgi:hypothetical protein
LHENDSSLSTTKKERIRLREETILVRVNML